MDGGPLLHPVGPEPASTYWFRRAVVVGLLVVLVAAVAYACGREGGSDRLRATATPTPAASTTSPPAPAAAERCDEQSLRVIAATDAETFPVGSSPRFTAVVRNVTDAPCRLASQPGARTWAVASGADQVWSTDDCADDSKVVLDRLGPRRQVTYAVTWDGHRSEPGCPGPGDEAQPGTYVLTVRVDGVRAKPVIFHLTG